LARAEELEADRRAVALTGNSLGLASGLLKVCRLLSSSRGFARRTALAVLRPGGRVSGRVTRLIALADGPSPVQPRIGWMPYALAACLVAVVGFQAAAGIARDDPAALAIVLGTPTTTQARVWNGDTARSAASAAARPHRPAKERRSWPAALRAEMQNQLVVAEKDVPRWLRSMNRLAKKGGLPLNLLQWERWQADPLFSRTTAGPVGIYRVEPRMFTRPLP
jgi:hypothetical protein